MQVKDVPTNFEFISDTQQVVEISKYLRIQVGKYDSFFVEVIDGDYGTVYGMFGIVPRLDKMVMKIK